MTEHDHPPYILGLDLGATSLGWAMIEIESWNTTRPVRVLDVGVRIFEAGVEGDIEQGKDSSRAVERRNARQPRRQHWRRQQRKRNLFRLLQELHLLPQTSEAVTDDEKRDDDPIAPANRHAVLLMVDQQLRKEFTAKDPNLEQDHHFQQVLPYLLRKEALERPLSPAELGRLLYQLGQRRGYLSNRKGQDSDDEKTGLVLSGISSLQDDLGEQTLGAYFATEVDVPQEKIRKRYTGRFMFQQEFERIRDYQAPHHPELTPEDWERIHKTIFYQRPLKSQKDLIGRCDLEPDRRRISEALPIFQEFRILQTVNNLRIQFPDYTARELFTEEKQKLIDILQTSAEMTYAQVRKLFGFTKKGMKFTIEEWDKRIIGHRTNQKMIDVFGDQWLDFPVEKQNQIVLEIVAYNKPFALKRRGIHAWGLNEEQADRLKETHLEEGHGSHSKEALEQLVPLMRDGMTYPKARKKAYPESFETGDVHDLLAPVNDWKDDIRNPAVIRALTELRKVVNGIIRRHGKPQRIHIELARDLKNSRDRRKKIHQNNEDNRKRREKAKQKILSETGISRPSRNDIDKCLLAEECQWTCPYTGKTISPSNLFGPHPEFDIEHIYPRQYLDNSMSNKTLCHVSVNRDIKRNQLPAQAFSGKKHEEMIDRVKRFVGPLAHIKLHRFQQTEVPEGFTTRDLNDTRYNSKLSAEFLGTLYGGKFDAEGRTRIFSCTGGLTYLLRKAWQLDSILGDDEKNRDDHRQHAVDAVIVALTGPTRVKALQEAAADAAKMEQQAFLKSIQNPWNKFHAEVDQAVTGLKVSHRMTRTIAGPLHAESIYSREFTDANGKTSYRIRKGLDKLSVKEITSDQIVDPKIRQLVQDKYAELGGGPPAKIFSLEENHPVMTTRNGKEIPIHKVRLQANVQPRPIGKGVRQRNVASGKDSNYASMIYVILDKNGQ
ncbi:MAG: type II CRISPR RNA-guided endonuclease Cas9, partial [Planctomycetaceae bacterium]|nr:type II CRISPR RNA-guided endonuclease Cas9 [Planctomycetaceae bacterium]